MYYDKTYYIFTCRFTYNHFRNEIKTLFSKEQLHYSNEIKFYIYFKLYNQCIYDYTYINNIIQYYSI